MRLLTVRLIFLITLLVFFAGQIVMRRTDFFKSDFDEELTTHTHLIPPPLGGSGGSSKSSSHQHHHFPQRLMHSAAFVGTAGLGHSHGEAQVEDGGAEDDLPAFVVNQSRNCRNTVQGRVLIADSNGLLCSPDDINPGTNCCATPIDPHPFSCALCNDSVSSDTLQSSPSEKTISTNNGGNPMMCCPIYERCVACCQHPRYTKHIRQSLYRQRNHPLFVSVQPGDPFAFCVSRCRTNSASTIHENRFVSALVHCF